MLHSTYFYLLYTEIIWLLTFVINKPLVTVLKIHKIFVDSHKFTEPVSDRLWLVLIKLKLNLLFENNVNNFGFSECVSGVHFFKSKTLFYDVIQRGRKKTYNHNESNNTGKYFVAIAPQGRIILISKGFGGQSKRGMQ